MAAKMSIGIINKDSKMAYNLSQLRKRSRLRLDKKSGRKRPRRNDYEVIAAPDSEISMNTSQIMTQVVNSKTSSPKKPMETIQEEGYFDHIPLDVDPRSSFEDETVMEALYMNEIPDKEKGQHHDEASVTGTKIKQDHEDITRDEEVRQYELDVNGRGDNKEMTANIIKEEDRQDKHSATEEEIGQKGAQMTDKEKLTAKMRQAENEGAEELTQNEMERCGEIITDENNQREFEEQLGEMESDREVHHLSGDSDEVMKISGESTDQSGDERGEHGTVKHKKILDTSVAIDIPEQKRNNKR